MLNEFAFKWLYKFWIPKYLSQWRTLWNRFCYVGSRLAAFRRIQWFIAVFARARCWWTERERQTEAEKKDIHWHAWLWFYTGESSAKRKRDIEIHLVAMLTCCTGLNQLAQGLGEVFLWILCSTCLKWTHTGLVISVKFYWISSTF